MIYQMNLSAIPFGLIKNQQKVVEMRLKTRERENIKAGDLIEFTKVNSHEKLTVEVLSVSSFPSFKELYDAFDKKDLGYSENEPVNYRDMNLYYKDEDIQKYGVLAISIKLVK